MNSRERKQGIGVWGIGVSITHISGLKPPVTTVPEGSDTLPGLCRQLHSCAHTLAHTAFKNYTRKICHAQEYKHFMTLLIKGT